MFITHYNGAISRYKNVSVNAFVETVTPLVKHLQLLHKWLMNN